MGVVVVRGGAGPGYACCSGVVRGGFWGPRGWQERRGEGCGEPVLVCGLGPASADDQVQVVAGADVYPGDLGGGAVVESAAQGPLARQRSDERPRGREGLLLAEVSQLAQRGLAAAGGGPAQHLSDQGVAVPQVG